MTNVFLIVTGAVWLASIIATAMIVHHFTARSFLSKPLVRLAVGAEPVIAQIGGIYAALSPQLSRLWSGRSDDSGSAGALPDAVKGPFSIGGTVNTGTPTDGRTEGGSEGKAIPVSGRVSAGEARGSGKESEKS